jgi:hypothetical protein
MRSRLWLTRRVRHGFEKNGVVDVAVSLSHLDLAGMWFFLVIGLLSQEYAVGARSCRRYRGLEFSHHLGYRLAWIRS